MDGEITHVASPEIIPARRAAHVPPSRAKRVRWFVYVALLVALVLGGLYGFNAYRNRMIAQFFANNKPPPAQISAVTATSEAVPHFVSGVGSLAAVHQVTVTPEVGGRVTEIDFAAGAKVKAGDKLIQINDAPDLGDLANYQAQQRWAEVSLDRAQALAARQYGPQQNVDQWQSQLDQAKAMINKTQAIIAQKEIRAPFGGELGVRQVDLGQYLNPAAFTSAPEAPNGTGPNDTDFGNSGVGIVRGPGQRDLDMALERSILISESHSVHLRAEFFNFTNTPNFANPNNAVSFGPAFGKITAKSNNPRIIQVALQYQF